MYKILITAVTAIVLFSATSHAEDNKNKDIVDLKDYMTGLDNGKESNLSDIAKGINAANKYLKEQKRQPLYCPPDNFVITEKQYVKILKNVYGKGIFDDLLPIDSLGGELLSGLQEAFPCPNNL